MAGQQLLISVRDLKSRTVIAALDLGPHAKTHEWSRSLREEPQEFFCETMREKPKMVFADPCRRYGLRRRAQLCPEIGSLPPTFHDDMDRATHTPTLG